MTYREGNNDTRCPVCSAEWIQSDMMKIGVKGCPHCGTTAQLLNKKHDGYIKINWQDLRVLAIYAERWSSMFDMSIKGNQDAVKALQKILENLRTYRPKDGAPLTIPLTPIVIVHKHPPHEHHECQEPPRVHIAFDETKRNLKPDGTGNIPSPFYRKN